MLEFVIPCLLGLESLVGDEIRKLGLSDVRVENGRVLCRGEARDIARLNINLRCGARVILVLHKFRATDFESLFQGVRAVHWEDWIPREGEFPVVGYSINSTLHSVPACQSIVKKAVVDRLSAAYGIAQFPETGRRYQVRFSIMKDEVTLMLDTSGVGLHKRGYRRESNAAPIKETLAAGIIDLARIRENDTVCDPFCGSGTLLIEAGLKALNIAPGLNRSFAAERLGFVSDKAWRAARSEAADAIKRDAKFRAFGYDIDGECISLTLSNAKKAAPQLNITAERRDIRDYAPPADELKIITNPPYGERMLEVEQAREIYRAMGERMLPLNGSQLYIITPDEEFETIFGQKADKNRKLYNGMIKCDLFMYGNV